MGGVGRGGDDESGRSRVCLLTPVTTSTATAAVRRKEEEKGLLEKYPTKNFKQISD